VPPGSRRLYETERVGIELFMRFVGHAEDAVQLLEHRIFDAAGYNGREHRRTVLTCW